MGLIVIPVVAQYVFDREPARDSLLFTLRSWCKEKRESVLALGSLSNTFLVAISNHKHDLRPHPKFFKFFFLFSVIKGNKGRKRNKRRICGRKSCLWLCLPLTLKPLGAGNIILIADNRERSVRKIMPGSGFNVPGKHVSWPYTRTALGICWRLCLSVRECLQEKERA